MADHVGCSDIEWEGFLARHDLLWDKTPHHWAEAPFHGNGMLGCMLYYSETEDAIRLEMGRSDVQNHRTPITNTGVENGRYPVGHFLLRTAGVLQHGCSWRLSLYDAVTKGTITTSAGQITFQMYAHATKDIIIFDATGLGDEAQARWEFVPAEAVPARQTRGLQIKDQTRYVADWAPNPPVSTHEEEGLHYAVQHLLEGGGSATVWHDNNSNLSVGCSFVRDQSATIAAQTSADDVRQAVSKRDELRREHVDWWHTYYPSSFFSFSDSRLETFYWIQMYKLASATRANGHYVDDQGPWLQPTPWSYATWNLNVQLIYWPAVVSNRAHLVDSLINVLHRNSQQLIHNCDPKYRDDSATLLRACGSDLDCYARPPRFDDAVGTQQHLRSVGAEEPPEVGNLPWALHNCWMVYKHTMDDELLRKKIFPLLRRTTNYYIHFLRSEADGKLHLPPLFSPEYASARDTNYNLAILRWSCRTLLEANKRLHLQDPLAAKWQWVLDNLVPYPQNETGFMIGNDQELESSHRHYSHLLMVYPFYEVNREQEGGPAIIERSLKHWQSMTELLEGYSSTGGSSISSALRDGDAARAYLDNLFVNFIHPNTMYHESGPVIETPLSAAQSLMDMVLQSWGGVVRPFPAVPSSWSSAVFVDFTAEGGFLVSGRWREAGTSWLSIKSLAGEPLCVETDIRDPMIVGPTGQKPVRRDSRGYCLIDAESSEWVRIYPRGTCPDFDISSVPCEAAETNTFGLNARTLIPTRPP